MTSVTVEVLPMFDYVASQLMTMYSDILALETIIGATRQLQSVTQGLSDHSVGVDGPELADKLHVHQEQSLETATKMLDRVHEELSGILDEYLAEHRITKGMTLLDAEGKPFKLVNIDLICDQYVTDRTENDDLADTVEILLGEEDSAVRLSFYLSKGTTLTIVK